MSDEANSAEFGLHDRNAAMSATLYNGARNEIIKRIELRDKATGLFLTAISGISAISIGIITLIGDQPEQLRYGLYLLLLVPILSFVSASIVAQHHALIGAIEAYLVVDLGAALKSQGIHLPQWDASEQVIEMKSFSINIRGNQWLMPFIGLSFLTIFIVLQARYVGFGLSDTFVNQGDILDAVQAAIRNRVVEVTLAIGAFFLIFRSWYVLNKAQRKRREYLEAIKDADIRSAHHSTP